MMFYEVLTLAQRNGEIAAELTEFARPPRTVVADALRSGSEAGGARAAGRADDAAAFLFALADGLTIRVLTEPELHDSAPDGPGGRRGPRAARVIVRRPASPPRRCAG